MSMSTLELEFVEYLKNATLTGSSSSSGDERSSSTQNHAVTDIELRKVFGDQYTDLPVIINRLVKEGRVRLLQNAKQELMYAPVSVEMAEKTKGLSTEHRMVLSEIEKSGNVGVWTRDIKHRTNIPQQVITKILRLLETRRLVKSVKSITNKNKKLYMLYDVVPSRDITGGPWYNDQEFDHGFIETVCHFVIQVIRKEGMSTVTTLTDRVRASGLSRVQLGLEEMTSILQVLVYDRKVELVRPVPGQATRVMSYKLSSVGLSHENYLTETPCGLCPVFDQCQTGNVIAPETCVYMTAWLSVKDSF